MKQVSLFLGLLLGVTARAASGEEPNIVVISLEDLSATDWDFDVAKFNSLLSESVVFSSHYSGYQASAAQSQLMTGIHAYHAGYGQLGESFSFGHATIGGVPLQHKMLSEHLQARAQYASYYVGTWGLGYSVREFTPNARGFDYFYGSYSGENDVMSKQSGYSANEYTDPSMIVGDAKQYYDFWENDKAISRKEASTKDSVSQYAEKAASIIENHNGAKGTSAFYLHVTFQGAQKYFDKKFHFGKDVQSKCTQYAGMENRQFMCEYTTHVERNVGKIVHAIKETGEWDNTVLLVVSNNGGSAELGACNYPLRGGKNSFFEGNMNTFALVSGGLLPASRQGVTLSGLVSNVDWAPTLLSFAGLIEHDVRSVSSFDGLNMYNYIMNDEYTSDSLGMRDHIVFHISPWGHDNFKVYSEAQSNEAISREWGWDGSSNDDKHITLEEIGMVFYDDDGKLWKYFVMDDYFDNENEAGLYSNSETNINLNYNWCVQDSDSSMVTGVDFSDNVGVLSGLYDLDSDASEQYNLLTSIDYSSFMSLKDIVKEKADYLLNNEVNAHSQTLYNGMEFGAKCFYDRKNVMSYGVTNTENNVWAPFIADMNEYMDILANDCGLSAQHMLFKLHSNENGQSAQAMKKEDVKKLRMKQLSSSIKSGESLAHEMHDLSRVSKAKKKAKVEATYVSEESMRSYESSQTWDKYAKYTQDFDMVMTDSDNVYSSCDGLSDGFYMIQVDFDTSKPVLRVECSNEYMVVNYQFDENWDSYFSSFFQSHRLVASPFKSDAADWESWFLPDSKQVSYDYVVSPLCNSCDDESLYQMNDEDGSSTTYWENAVNSYCATNARGQPAGDAKWQSYICRESVYNHGTSKSDITSNNLLYATFVDEWIVTDLNGIDKEVLLTPLAGKNSGNLGTCLTLKQASDNEHFSSITECEKSDVGNGNVPTIGMKGEYCVCAKQAASSELQSQRQNEKRRITEAELESVKSMAQQVQEKVFADSEDNEDAGQKVYYLYQTDFQSGTYRIQEPGTYMLMEDIVFDYNSPNYDASDDYSANSVFNDDGDIYWYPQHSQKSEYPGAYEFHDAYLLGFFAGITIESDNVVIDLNGKELTMDERYFYQQPWWSHIEIGSQAFVPGEGPSHFGADPTYVANIEIKNGILGLTSHHCVHGTAPEASLMQNVVIKDVVCKDFITHGIQLNGFNGLTIDNVEIGPSASKQYLTVDYSQMRTLLPRFEYFADLYGDDETFTFGGKPSQEYIAENDLHAKVSLSNDKEYTLREILDEMIVQMDMAFDYVTKRKTEDELNDEYGAKWLQAKRVFVSDDQSGIPYGGVIYGLYLNYPSSGISGFYRNSDKSYDVQVNNLYIHDITHSSREEAYLLKSMRSVFALPIVARLWMGEDGVTGFNDYAPNDEIDYYGTIVYDWLVAFYSILKDDVSNVEATNLLYFGDSAISWVSGESSFTGMELSNDFLLTCNGDPMFHSVKGIFGLRLANVKDAVLSEVTVENLRELSPVGSDVCGAYQRSHDIQQQLPYLYGFTGNNIHGVSVIDSNVLFDNLHVLNLNSLTGNSTGMTVYPRANVRFDGENNHFSNIVGGSQFLGLNMDYATLSPMLGSPNQMPRGCAVKSETFEHYESQIIIESMTESDGTKVNVGCVAGYVGCDDEEMKGWTNFGTLNSESSQDCARTSDTMVNEIEDGMAYLNQHQTRVPLFRTKSKHGQLMHMLAESKKNGNNQGTVTGSSSSSSASSSHMIFIMVGIMSVAVLFVICSFVHSMYGQAKLQEMNAEWKGYQKI